LYVWLKTARIEERRTRTLGQEEHSTEDIQEEERTFREDATENEKAAAKAREEEREMIARAILGEGEFFLNKLKELLRIKKELIDMHPGLLAEMVESRLKGINDWSPLDCEEFLEDVEKKFRRLTAYLLAARM
jgi:hypothetical protein